jgi:VCBS repeat-containing protein
MATVDGLLMLENAITDLLPNYATYVADEDTVLNVPDGATDILANDITAPDVGETLTFVDYDDTTPNGASVTVNADGTFTYDPTGSATIQQLDEGAQLTDTFTYTITDSLGRSSTASVTVEILSDNDLPIVVGESYTMAA